MPKMRVAAQSMAYAMALVLLFVRKGAAEALRGCSDGGGLSCTGPARVRWGGERRRIDL